MFFGAEKYVEDEFALRGAFKAFFLNMFKEYFLLFGHCGNISTAPRLSEEEPPAAPTAVRSGSAASLAESLWLSGLVSNLPLRLCRFPCGKPLPFRPCVKSCGFAASLAESLSLSGL